ncbi:ribonuclease H-like domain-containing protein [Tanacetum coccineum]
MDPTPTTQSPSAQSPTAQPVASAQPTSRHPFPTGSTSTIIPDPPTNPNPVSTHSMVTRYRVGSNHPHDRLTLHVSSISPLPKFYRDAFNDPKWKNAMCDEYHALIKSNTWTLVPRPTDTNVVHCMWLFRHKYHADGTLSRYKARLVANGSTQIEGIDVDETFSLVVKPNTIRTRSLYGLKQAPRAWFQHLASYITRSGFSHSRGDSSLFIYRQGIDTDYLLLYVDDIVLTAFSEHLLQQLIHSLHQEFSMTDLGSLNYFLGISVTRDSSGMFLSQRKYATEILERAYMVGCNSNRTPVDTESKLGDGGDPVSDLTLYRSLAGYLQYLTFTRPDISYAVQQVCLYMHDPREPHFSALKRILRYVIGTLDYGYCVFLGNNLLSWSSKRQPTLSRSSAEAEYRGIDNAVAKTFAAGQVRVLHQFADIFTKGLPSALFEEFRSSLSVWYPHDPTAEEC